MRAGYVHQEMKVSEKIGAQDRYRDISQQKTQIKQSRPKLESYMVGSIGIHSGTAGGSELHSYTRG